MDKSLPVGVFDSGVGGLTVLKELMEILPNETFIYLGDTKRVPYGTRTKEEIETFSLELEEFFLNKKIKALVVACNTISAVCLTNIKEKAHGIPVVDVISPTVRKALDETSGSIGILATNATVASNAYPNLINKLSPSTKVSQIAAPILVPLIEKGILSGPEVENAVKQYVEVLSIEKIDTLILGSTHYPIIRDVIVKIIGSSISVVGSARPTAEALEEVLIADNLKSDSKSSENKYFVTGDPTSSQKVADLFFGNKFPGTLQQAII